MPNKKNAEKALRQSIKKNAANDKVRFSIHDMKRKIRKALEANLSISELQGLYKQAQVLLDKASKNNVIKKNSASRKKASFAKMINSKANPVAGETTKVVAKKKSTGAKKAVKKTTTKKSTATKKTTKK